MPERIFEKKDPFLFPEAREAKDVLIIEGNQAIAHGVLFYGKRPWDGQSDKNINWKDISPFFEAD